MPMTADKKPPAHEVLPTVFAKLPKGRWGIWNFRTKTLVAKGTLEEIHALLVSTHTSDVSLARLVKGRWRFMSQDDTMTVRLLRNTHGEPITLDWAKKVYQWPNWDHRHDYRTKIEAGEWPYPQVETGE